MSNQVKAFGIGYLDIVDIACSQGAGAVDKYTAIHFR